MPRYDIDRSTNFIIEKESWNLIEYDYTSVPGTIYLSLTEGKINSIYDDTINNIADTDKLAKYSIALPSEIQTIEIGATIEPIFTLTKDGIPINEDYVLLSTDEKIVEIMDTSIIGKAAGKVDIIVQLKDYPFVQQIIPIQVVAETVADFSAYIDGPATIRLDRSENYVLKLTNAEYDGVCKFELYHTIIVNAAEATSEEYIYFDHPKQSRKKIAIKKSDGASKFELETTLAKHTFSNQTCTVIANTKDKLGYIVLGCIYNTDQIAFKTIEIIPLW